MLSAPLPPAPPSIVRSDAPLSPFAEFGGVPTHVKIDPFLQFGGHATVQPDTSRIVFHHKMAPLFQPKRFKVAWGGRGGVKSWSYAQALLIRMLQQPTRVVCAREYMSTIKDSVHQLLVDQIERLGFGPWFRTTSRTIRCVNGSTCTYISLADLHRRQGRTRVKSLEGVDILWVEEAENISSDAWDIVLPTIRKQGSEIWITLNPLLAEDATYQKFVVNPPADAVVIPINWDDNIWLSQELLALKNWMQRVDPEAYEHVWNGQLKKYAAALVFRGKCVVEDFETPEFDPATKQRIVFRHGVDWGFADDPLAIVRCYITGTFPNEELWIDREVFEQHVSLDLMENRFDEIPTMRKWPIRADAAQPAQIDLMRRRGFNIAGAKKWAGSVEDGIEHLRAFKAIHIHKTNCPHTAAEFTVLYKFKVDVNTNEVLPHIVDKNNHTPDAVRYALDGVISSRGVGAVWARLGRAPGIVAR